MTVRVERIGFGPGAAWGAYSQTEMARWAQRPDISPRAMRVLMAAMGRHDRGGHARFAKGELAEWLGSADATTGLWTDASGPAVSDAIKVAKRLGFTTEESTVRCLVVPHYAFQKAQGSSVPCPVHA